jgi:hypothetical protein
MACVACFMFLLNRDVVDFDLPLLYVTILCEVKSLVLTLPVSNLITLVLGV